MAEHTVVQKTITLELRYRLVCGWHKSQMLWNVGGRKPLCGFNIYFGAQAKFWVLGKYPSYQFPNPINTPRHLSSFSFFAALRSTWWKCNRKRQKSLVH